MEHLAKTLIILGSLFLLGLLTDVLGRRTPLPRVTLLLVVGFIIGPSALDILPEHGRNWFPLVADMALVMVGFLLGEKLKLSSLREHGGYVLWISLSDVFATALVMGAGLMLVGVPPEMALVAAQRFPGAGDTILTVVVAATVIFEIFGPVLTRRAVVLAGEAHPEEE